MRAMKKILILFILFSSLVSAEVLKDEDYSLQLDGQERDGSWPDNARGLLQKLIIDLKKSLQKVEDHKISSILSSIEGYRENAPVLIKDVNSKFLIELLNKVKQKDNLELNHERSQPNSIRLFYYNVKTLEIFPTVNYYLTYEPYSYLLAPLEIKLEIQRKLLHEMAHLWGYDETRAKVFSVAMITLLGIGDLGPKLTRKVILDSLSKHFYNIGSSEFLGHIEELARVKFMLRTDRPWSCVEVSGESDFIKKKIQFKSGRLEQTISMTENGDQIELYFSLDGITNKDKSKHILFVGNDTLMIEVSQLQKTAKDSDTESLFSDLATDKRVVTSYMICRDYHLSRQEVVRNFINPFIRAQHDLDLNTDSQKEFNHTLSLSLRTMLTGYINQLEVEVEYKTVVVNNINQLVNPMYIEEFKYCTSQELIIDDKNYERCVLLNHMIEMNTPKNGSFMKSEFAKNINKLRKSIENIQNPFRKKIAEKLFLGMSEFINSSSKYVNQYMKEQVNLSMNHCIPVLALPGPMNLCTIRSRQIAAQNISTFLVEHIYKLRKDFQSFEAQIKEI